MYRRLPRAPLRQTRMMATTVATPTTTANNSSYARRAMSYSVPPSASVPQPRVSSPPARDLVTATKEAYATAVFT
jgi:hypothetical protein